MPVMGADFSLVPSDQAGNSSIYCCTVLCSADLCSADKDAADMGRAASAISSIAGLPLFCFVHCADSDPGTPPQHEDRRKGTADTRERVARTCNAMMAARAEGSWLRVRHREPDNFQSPLARA